MSSRVHGVYKLEESLLTFQAYKLRELYKFKRKRMIDSPRF